MTVGDEDGANLVLVFEQVSDVRNRKVDSWHIFFWEQHSGVDNYDVVTVFQHHHVLAYFAETTKGNNT